MAAEGPISEKKGGGQQLYEKKKKEKVQAFGVKKTEK